MTGPRAHTQDRAATVTTAVIQVLRVALLAWFDSDHTAIAEARSEIEMLLRNEFEEIGRQARDEITLTD